MDFPYTVAPEWINSYQDYFGAQSGWLVSASSAASSGWPAANRALYFPFQIPFRFNARRAFWMNGSTVTGNVDIGIYSGSGKKIWSSGSTAQSGASALQFVAISPTVILVPGAYYIGLTNNGTTNRMGGTSSISNLGNRMMGTLQEDSALPLPSAMTPAVMASSLWFLCGITSTDS